MHNGNQYILVLKKTSEPTFSIIVEGSDVSRIFRAAYYRVYERNRRRRRKWTPKADAFIADNYRLMLSRDIADHLNRNARAGQKYTRNMVIGRARRLGLAQEGKR